MPVTAPDIKSIDCMQHADSKQIVMTTGIYLQSYKTATLFSTRNHSFCFKLTHAVTLLIARGARAAGRPACTLRVHEGYTTSSKF